MKDGFRVVDEAPQAFLIAGSDRKFYPADASIVAADTIFVSSPNVPQPVAVRYAWANDPVGCNLFTRQGYPATPFRSDNWEHPHAYDLLKAGPQFEPARAEMEQPQQQLTMSVPDASTTIYYTLDGTAPSADSAVYRQAITLQDQTWVRALGIDDLGRTTLESKSFYHIPPPTPPEPMVRLEQLDYSYGTTGRGKITKNLHYNGHPMTVKGARYDHGISVHSPSEIRYPLDPSYKQFVISAAVNDDNHDLGTVAFIIQIDGKQVARSPVIGMGTIWHFNLDLPRRPGIDADHHRWRRPQNLRRSQLAERRLHSVTRMRLALLDLSAEPSATTKPIRPVARLNCAGAISWHECILDWSESCLHVAQNSSLTDTL